MHMGLQDKLQHYAAPEGALVVGIDGPLTADAIVDAHLRALEGARPLVLVHTGEPTAVALRMAARFHVTLIDAATLPEPAAPPAAAPEPVLALPPHVPDAPVPPVLAAPAQPFPLPMPGFFRALEREPPALAFDALALPLFDPPPAPETIVAASAPEPEVAHAPLLEEGRLPWADATLAPEPAAVPVEEDEFESMPWNVVHHQLLPAGRTTRPAAPRPSMAPDWGLPWPRPVAPTGGLAVADPRLWHAQERIGAIREDLDRAGAPSFGLAKPEGSAWLKRLHEFGSP